jgi:hypothetical protein
VQAGWKSPVAPSSLDLSNSNGQPISVRLVSDPASPPLGSLILQAGATSVTIRQNPGAVHVERSVKTSSHTITSLAPCDPSSPAELVAAQLSRGGRNSLYQKILPRFRVMLSL